MNSDSSSAQPQHGGSGLRRLSGRHCVVTGASSGIGRATAIRLAQEGASLLIHARQNQTGLSETLSLLSTHAASDQSHTMLFADLADLDECAKLVQEAWAWHTPINAWVHLAGADVLTGEARGWSFDQKLEMLWRTDVRGTMATTREVGRRMVLAQTNSVNSSISKPVIITVGWDQAAHGMAGDAGEMFGAIKGGVMAFTQSLARSLAPHVRVANVAPGWIQTAWGVKADPYWDQRARDEALLARWGTVDDVAGAIAFLVSDDAQFITGQVLPVNGGFRHPFDPAG